MRWNAFFLHQKCDETLVAKTRLAKGWRKVGERLAKGWQKIDERLAKGWRKVGERLAKGWRKVGERLAKGWRKVGEKLAKGWRKVGERLAKGWRKVGERLDMISKLANLISKLAKKIAELMSLEKWEIIPKLAKLPIEFGKIGDWRNWRLSPNSATFVWQIGDYLQSRQTSP